jgi:hypothetical protein
MLVYDIVPVINGRTALADWLGAGGILPRGEQPATTEGQQVPRGLYLYKVRRMGPKEFGRFLVPKLPSFQHSEVRTVPPSHLH